VEAHTQTSSHSASVKCVSDVGQSSRADYVQESRAGLQHHGARVRNSLQSALDHKAAAVGQVTERLLSECRRPPKMGWPWSHVGTLRWLSEWQCRHGVAFAPCKRVMWEGVRGEWRVGRSGGSPRCGVQRHSRTHARFQQLIESHREMFFLERSLATRTYHTQPRSHHRCQQLNFTQLASKFQPRMKQCETTTKKLCVCGSLECNARAVEGWWWWVHTAVC
jgi:hypothetical protein